VEHDPEVWEAGYRDCLVCVSSFVGSPDIGEEVGVKTADLDGVEVLGRFTPFRRPLRRQERPRIRY